MINGILPVYKPVGVTSADVVSQLRYLLRMKKVGHAGTLDPSVDGVLPIALGAATKAVPALMDLGKTYLGGVILGFATETEDLDGAEIERVRLYEPFSTAQIKAAMRELTGQITQIPPMYSAVKVNGRRLYDYARRGETVERPVRQATIYAFDMLKEPVFDGEKGEQRFSFEAQVSKGTYIRTLAVDVGQKLGVPAVMSGLTRIKSGGFVIGDTIDLRPLTRETAVEAVLEALKRIEFAYPNLPLYALGADEWVAVQNGRELKIDTAAERIGLTQDGVLKAVYRKQKAFYRPDVMFLANTMEATNGNH